MPVWVTVLVLAMATNPTIAQNVERASVVYAETLLAKLLAYRWRSCLNLSFHIQRRLTAD
jgi:hypothetical protein